MSKFRQAQPTTAPFHFLRSIRYPLYWAAAGLMVYGAYHLFRKSETHDELKDNASKKDQTQLAGVAVSADPKLTARLGIFERKEDSHISVEDSIKGVIGSTVNIGAQSSPTPKSDLK